MQKPKAKGFNEAELTMILKDKSHTEILKLSTQLIKP